jgi:hypothetical protein
MKSKKWLILLASLAIVLLASSVGRTMAFLFDQESSSNNTFEAWASTVWVQTSKTDFEAGVLSDIDTSTSPGDVKLEIVLQEPTTSVGSEESWYFTSWSCRAPVTISNPGSGLTDYQVRVDVTYDADMQPDFDDIRFVDSDDSTELAHWRESYIDSTSAVFWVKVPSIPSGSKVIYMYYGNGSASDASDGDATFAFFDDFLGASLDMGKWYSWNANPSVSGSVVTITNTGDWGGIFSNTQYSLPYIFVARVQKTTEFGIGQVGLERWYASTGDDTLNVFDTWGGTRPQVYYTSKHDGTDEWDEVGTWNLSTWYHYEIKGKPDEVRYYRDGGLQNTETTITAIPTGPMDIILSSGATNDQLLVDYCFIAQYAAPEPTASIGTEDGWSRRALVTINNPGSALTDYQIMVDVTYDADMQPDFDDIRFRDSDGSTELAHWRESYIDSTSAVFWVKVPSVPSGNKTIYMYYGNDAASDASDGDATFEFFDDFEDGDISDWSQYVNGIVQIANDGGNYVLLKTAYNDRNGGYSLFNNGALSNFEAVFRTKRINETGGNQNRYGIEDSSFNGYGPRMYDFNSLPSNFAIEQRTGGVGTNLAVKSTSAYEWNTWMTVKFRRYGSTLEFELYDSSGSLVESISTSNSLYNSFDRFVVHGGWEFYTDDIRVRKYAPQSAYVSSGTIASQVLDTGIAGAIWNALFWDETLPSNTDITFEVRASDTVFTKDAATPNWIDLGLANSPITSGLPSGRYMQWRATLNTSDTSETPILHEVRVWRY